MCAYRIEDYGRKPSYLQASDVALEEGCQGIEGEHQGYKSAQQSAGGGPPRWQVSAVSASILQCGRGSKRALIGRKRYCLL